MAPLHCLLLHSLHYTGEWKETCWSFAPHPRVGGGGLQPLTCTHPQILKYPNRWSCHQCSASKVVRLMSRPPSEKNSIATKSLTGHIFIKRAESALSKIAHTNFERLKYLMCF